ncbi:MAG: hypothetical protein FWG82_04750 [Oscillospiraceae bacterium]|nr:hypothetical protein [Oscillospiraceae bacterium]
MKCFNFSARKIDAMCAEDDSVQFIVCAAREVKSLGACFGFDRSTVLECTDLDENVRYAAFEGYDFISAVLLRDDNFAPEELDFYAAENYCILVLPDNSTNCSADLAASLMKLAENLMDKSGEKISLKHIYYMFWQGLLAHYSDILNALEDKIEDIAEETPTAHYAAIETLRRKSYKAQKYLRALSFLCTQIVSDSNGLLNKEYGRLFKGIEIRVKMLREFAAELYELSGEVMASIQNHKAAQMNRTMSTLTVITLFFAPLTVITGIYGMNFHFMPELRWRYGYFAVLGVMAGICGVMWFIAKRKKWM